MNSRAYPPVIQTITPLLPAVFRHAQPWTYWLIRIHQHELASMYPVVAPIYLPAVIWLNHYGWEQPQIDRASELMEKFSAS